MTATVLVEASFIDALRDVEHLRHADAVALYRALLDDFQRQRYRLVATADHLAAVPEEQRRSLLAAVATLHIAGQHRRAATRTVAENDIDLDLATTLVMLERERIRRVVTFDARFDAYDVELVGGHTFSS